MCLEHRGYNTGVTDFEVWMLSLVGMELHFEYLECAITASMNRC